MKNCKKGILEIAESIWYNEINKNWLSLQKLVEMNTIELSEMYKKKYQSEG